jgi:hypothetical protein
MNAAAFTMRNLDCDLADVSAAVAGDICQGDYFYLLAKQHNLIACVLKLRTAGDKNVCDAKKGIEALWARPLGKCWNAYDKDE